MIVSRALTRHVKPQALRSTMVAKALSKHQSCSCVALTTGQPPFANAHCHHGTMPSRWFSSSRFSDLVGEEDGSKSKQKKPTGDEVQALEHENGEAVDYEDGDEENDEHADDDEDVAEAKEDKDQFWKDINHDNFLVVPEIGDMIMNMFMEDPIKWNVDRLARRFEWSIKRVEATIYLQGLAAGLTQEELKEKIHESYKYAKARQNGVEMKVAREPEQKKEQEAAQDQDAQEYAEGQEKDDDDGDYEEYDGPLYEEGEDAVDNDGADLTEDQLAELRGDVLEVYRNPDFFFLNDEYMGYPPLARRMGKQQKTDKLSYKEAQALQAFASKHEIKLHKSFAKDFGKTTNRWKIAVRDTSRPQSPILMREHNGKLRFAKGDELKVRSWVKRDPYFNGLNLEELDKQG